MAGRGYYPDRLRVQPWEGRLGREGPCPALAARSWGQSNSQVPLGLIHSSTFSPGLTLGGPGGWSCPCWDRCHCLIFDHTARRAYSPPLCEPRGRGPMEEARNDFGKHPGCSHQPARLLCVYYQPHEERTEGPLLSKGSPCPEKGGSGRTSWKGMSPSGMEGKQMCLR